jgi:hypothetical protein
MKAILKKYWPLMISAVALVILVATFIANGSESEDAWLYIICVWLVIYSTYISYSQIKDK